MLLQESRQRALQLARAVAVDEADDALIAEERFVEKPLGVSVADAQRAVDAAAATGRTLMVGHLLEYHPGLRALKELADTGELGEQIFYIYGNRLNLGKLRADENALWSLGAHDVSVVLSLAGGAAPVEITAHGASYVRGGVEDVVFCFVRFDSGLVAHLHLSWLDPHKERRFTVVGSKRMATFDDMELERKLTVYDKGFDEDARTYGEYITRSGGSLSPQVANVEPLRIECEHFIESLRAGTGPVGRDPGLSAQRHPSPRRLAAIHVRAGCPARRAGCLRRAGAEATSLWWQVVPPVVLA